MKLSSLCLICVIFVLVTIIAGCTGNIEKSHLEKLKEKEVAPVPQDEIDKTKEFIANCKKEVKELLDNAHEQKEYKASARICKEAMDKALGCLNKAIGVPLEVVLKIDNFPGIASNDFYETDALMCYCKFNLADVDQQISAENDPFKKRDLLDKRLNESMKCQNIWISGLFPVEESPEIGGDDLNESTMFLNTCKDIMEMLKKMLRDESDPEKKNALWQKTFDISVWCIWKWTSGILKMEMGPEITADAYGLRDFFIEDCLYRIKKAKTEEEKWNITLWCNRTLDGFFQPIDWREKLENPFEKMIQDDKALKAPFCGDEKVNNEGEECDPPGQQSQCYEGEICNNNCLCEAVIREVICGDGILDISELCDGNLFSQQCLNSHQTYLEMNPNLVLECYNNCKACQSVPPNR
jgi:hypothetical protein